MTTPKGPRKSFSLRKNKPKHVRRLHTVVFVALGFVYLFGLLFWFNENETFDFLSSSVAARSLSEALVSNMNDAFHRFSVSRAANGPGSSNRDENCDLKVAVYVQVGYTSLWNDMLSCTANVVNAAKMRGCDNGVDVLVSLVRIDDKEPALMESTIAQNLQSLGVHQVLVKEFPNSGADVGSFLRMLSSHHSKSYDVILKMHTKGDDVWRERATESLCGTPEQVVSVMQHFQTDRELDMIAPQGTVFGPNTQPSEIFPHIVRKYNLQEPPAKAFDDWTRTKMNQVHRQLFPNGIQGSSPREIQADEMTICAGTMFWIRWSSLNTKELVRELPKLQADFTSGYKENLGLEHVLERLFATHIVLTHRRIAEISPAPRPLALYFPQYHPFPENDKFWGKGFTEWTLLKPLDYPGIRKPLTPDKGGLGYYDLMSRHVRKMQADIARNYGVNGFVYYHYWFSGSHAPDHHLVMQQVHEQMLLDGEPNLPFAFSWANEPWSKRWTGEEEEILLSQEYGDAEEWGEHFYYLLKFFKHPNYIRQDGKPVFMIYRLGHFGEKLQPMLDLWRKLAKESGLPGILFVNTIGNFRNADPQTAQLEQKARMDAAFHFWPQLWGSGIGPKQLKSWVGSINDIRGLLDTYPMQYWGSWTGFDRRPRDTKATPLLISTDYFDKGLGCSFQAMSGYHSREIKKNFYFLTAWNEWNEQALLEPDEKNGFGYLEALHDNLKHMPISYVYPRILRDEQALEWETSLKRCNQQDQSQ